MSKRVKIYGAGSIGNHLAQASRSLGWDVDICDIDAAALERTKNEIYPGRYGKWDEQIGLYVKGEEPTGDYDYIFIGTPPDGHIKVALDVIGEKPDVILVEKPLCQPDLADAQRLKDLTAEAGISVFTGYDHVVGGFGSICSGFD